MKKPDIQVTTTESRPIPEDAREAARVMDKADRWLEAVSRDADRIFRPRVRKAR